VIEENASLKLIPSKDVQGHTSMRKHQKHLFIKIVTVTVLNKDGHTAKVKLIKKQYSANVIHPWLF
jgi:hypothetical protein